MNNPLTGDKRITHDCEHFSNKNIECLVFINCLNTEICENPCPKCGLLKIKDLKREFNKLKCGL